MPSDDSAQLYGLASRARARDRCHVKIYDEVDDATPDSAEPRSVSGRALDLSMVFEPNFPSSSPRPVRGRTRRARGDARAHAK